VIKKVGKPVARTAPAAAAPENEPVAAPKPQATAPADEAARTEEAPEPPRADPQTAQKSDIVPSLPDDEVEAFFAESASTATRQRFETKDTPAASQPRARSTAEPASIADKLSRIRAVVSQQSNAADAPDFSEDQHADATVAPATKIADVIADEAKPEALASEKDVLADTLRDLEDALEEDDHSAAQDAATDIADETEDDDIAAILNRLDAEAAPEAEDAPAADTFDADDADTDDLDEDTLVGHGIDAADDDAMDQQIMAAMDSLQANPGLDDLDDLPAGNIFDKEHETAPEPAPALEAPEPAARPAPPRARVLKVKRATLEAAIEAGQLEEYDDDDDEDEAPRHSAQPQVRGHSSLSEEAEAELARELAELEADMKADDTAEVDAQAEAEIAAQAEAEAEARAAEEKRAAQETSKARAKISSAAEDDLTRLMEESKSKMEEPEAATRRDAFSHLRAAVATPMRPTAVIWPVSCARAAPSQAAQSAPAPSAPQSQSPRPSNLWQSSGSMWINRTAPPPCARAASLRWPLPPPHQSHHPTQTTLPTSPPRWAQARCLTCSKPLPICLLSRATRSFPAHS
jgi:pilus assembly protein FimV